MAGAILAGIQPDQGSVLPLDEIGVRNIAPRELTFRFDENQIFNPANLNGIRITRTGFDGTFGNGNDIAVPIGFFGVGDAPEQNTIIARFAERLPDDLYRIEVIGRDDPLVGQVGLRNSAGELFQPRDPSTDRDTIHFELRLGAQVEAVVPQPVFRVNNTLQPRLDRIDVYFNDDNLYTRRVMTGELAPAPDPSVVDPRFYQLVFTNDTLTTTDDFVFNPTTVTYDPSSDVAQLTFEADLTQLTNPVTGGLVGPGTWRLRIGTDELTPAQPQLPAPQSVTLSVEATSDFGTNGAVQIRFAANAAAAESFGTVPTIVVTKSDRGVGAGPRLTLVDNRLTVDLNTRAGSQTTAQQLIDAINANAAIRALFAASLVTPTATGSTNIAAPTITYSPIFLRGLGSSFDTATSLGTLSGQNLVFSSAIDPQPFAFDFPGANDEPGHRELPAGAGEGLSQHLNDKFGADVLAGVRTIFYNFKDIYGAGDGGVALRNVITDAQRTLAREAFELWSRYLGVQFIETPDQGTTIVTGDPRVLDPNDPNVANHALTGASPDLDFIVRVDPKYQNGMVVMDSARTWSDSFGGDWFYRAMIGIGFTLGLERASDLPPSNVMAYGSPDPYDGTLLPPEPVFPGNADILHGQHLHRPDSNDVDLYKFVVDFNNPSSGIDRRGVFRAELFSERLANASLLDATLSLYHEFEDIVEDPLTGRHTVTRRELIARNDNYYSRDPFLELSLDEGTYYLAVTASGNTEFSPLRENTGSGGRTQGAYELNVTFRPEIDERHVITDIDLPPESLQPGTALDGDADGVPGGVFNFWFQTRSTSNTIYVDKSRSFVQFPDGRTATSIDNITTALNAAQPGDLVRIVSNGGADGNVATTLDNYPYEIGFGNLAGQILDDGETMNVPQGVTVMIDNGALFKLRRSRIGVGSTSVTADRSGGALQVLGTPVQINPDLTLADGNPAVAGTQRLSGNVVFTSWLDESFGLDRNPPTTTPFPGDWGGIALRADLDNDQARRNLENEGIFLNVINHADIRYGGGGNVVIDAIQQVVNPIQISEFRPTITYNTITHSADAALSASPDSFEETNFRAPRFQRSTPFTPDYQRIGPDIHGNRLIDNSINGLFVRIATPAGDKLQPLTVPGRFDDTEVVHYVPENLVIQGSPGRVVLDTSRPLLGLITLTPDTGGTLAAGTYNYKLTFVDRNGYEGRPSEVTSSATLAQPGSIRLDNLTPVSGEFETRRLYRSSSTGTGPYLLVGELDGTGLTFVDTGRNLGATLQRDPPSVLGIGLAAADSGAAGLMTSGTFNYRLVPVDVNGNEGPASDPTASVSLTSSRTPAENSVLLTALPAAGGGFVGRNLYRSTASGAGPYVLVARLNATSTTFTDLGGSLGSDLDPSLTGVLRARLTARLKVDPGIVVKLEGSRIETQFGAQVIAEGLDGQPVIFTSKLDDRFGAGGTFDTNNDDRQGANEGRPSPADWGGIYAAHLAKLNLDQARIEYGGGVTRIEGTFSAFNVIELHQADARIANTLIAHNASGRGGSGDIGDRGGRTTHADGTIFVRGPAPVLLDNVIRDNARQALNVAADAFTHDLVGDSGRTSGFIDRTTDIRDNYGPLIRRNRLANNGLNGMEIRSGITLSDESIWDDTDIVHVVFGEIRVPDLHTFGGLRLKSAPDESLVVKLSGPGSVDNAYNTAPRAGAGFSALGRPLDVEDRIGGILHVVGQPGFPVVLTSLNDDTVGAGRQPDGSPMLDTNNNGIGTVPRDQDWRSVRLDQYSHDRNVEIILEQEPQNSTPPGPNALVGTSQVLGKLAPTEKDSDDSLRLGFQIVGVLNDPSDLDVYSFEATSGTEVWFDIDRTTPSLDTVVELIDSNGRILALSDDSQAESLDPSLLYRDTTIPSHTVNPLQKQSEKYQDRHSSGLPKDFGSSNPTDAGFRVLLPGTRGVRSPYHVRVRSSNLNAGDPRTNLVEPRRLRDGLSSGAYQLQVRMRETDEFGGSTVRYSDIRYATNGIEVFGLPAHSPLLGEAAEDNTNNNSFNGSALVPEDGPQALGNIFATDRAAISVAGSLSSQGDIDFYRFDVNYDALLASNIQHGGLVFDVDYADGLARANSTLTIFDANGRAILIGRDSNIADDRPGPSPDPSDPGDLFDLSRGSAGVLDPFIGTAAFPEGRYYAAITSNALIPAELNAAEVRLEPVDSLVRIAEDHVDASGGSTAADPLLPVLFDRSITPTGANLWHVTTTLRANEIGHGLTPAYDGSRQGGAFVSDLIPEVEPNNLFATAQSLETVNWSLAFNPNIGDFFTNTSTTIPHVTVTNGTGDGTYDFYSFVVPFAGARGIFDIDSTNAFTDTELFLFDNAGTLIAANDDFGTFVGQGGSTNFFDSYIQTIFPAAGAYVIGVARFPSFSFGGGTINGAALRVGDVYELQVSIEGHPSIVTTGAGGPSFYFGQEGSRNYDLADTPAQGEMTSNAFSLQDYTAADKPVFYFTYLADIDVTGDRLRVHVDRPNGPSTLVASTLAGDITGDVRRLTADTVWRQARIELDDFAGLDNLRLRFDFLSDGLNDTNEGVYLDDFVIGFAERGEMITNARPNTAFVANPDLGTGEFLTGTYQLEIRKSTTYGTTINNVAGGLILDESFDTNARLTEQTTLIVPPGVDLFDGRLLVLGDGVSRQTFEFDSNNLVTPGNVPVRFTPADPDYVVAARLRDAVNDPAVQAVLQMSAGLSDATNSGTTSRSNLLNLYGAASGDFFELDTAPLSIASKSTNAAALRDAIVGTGVTAVGAATFQGGAESAGFFTGGAGSIGIGAGILLSTGDVDSAVGPNVDDRATGVSSGTGDALLDAAFGLTGANVTRDATSLEFDVTVPAGNLYLSFVFASEEYNESIAAARDVLGVFVDGTASNLALVPGTALPVNSANVNGGNPLGTGASNTRYFRNNDPRDAGAWLNELGYDGFTSVITATAVGLTAGTHRIRIAIADTRDTDIDSAVFIPNGGLTTVAPAFDRRLPAILHEGFGDQNLFRDQGQVLIHSNTVRDYHDYGIVVDAGERNVDGSFPVGLLQPHAGPVRNLRTGNDTPQGGFAPGVVVANNTVSGEGIGGIHVSGDLRPWEIVPPEDILDFFGLPFPGRTSADFLCDGDIFTITAYDQTVTFEFEETSGGAGACLNSVIGGDGVLQGNVPVYFEQSTSRRLFGFNQEEMAFAIREAIERSTLVVNNSTRVVRTVEGPSRALYSTGFSGTGGTQFAVYVEHAVAISDINFGAIPEWELLRQVPISDAAQPFVRVVNNTIVGGDGSLGMNPEPLVEPNDFLSQAIDTRQGRPHSQVSYTANAAIGDSPSLRFDRTLDVDFYQVHLDIGDRLVVDVDAQAINSTLNSVLRIFDAQGDVVAFNDNALVGEPGFGTNDSYLNFLATSPGTYYIGVSGAGNEAYDARSLGNRNGPASSGTYRIDINVHAPRDFLITLDANGTLAIPAATYTITGVDNQTRTINTASLPGFPTLFFFVNGVGVSGAAQVLANAINAAGIPGVTARPYGSRTNDPTHPGYDNYGPVPTRAYERYVFVEGAADITGPGLLVMPQPGSNIDQLLIETGLHVSERSTVTALNNVFSNTNIAVTTTGGATATIGGSAYQNVLGGMSTTDFNITLSNTEPLFVDGANDNFIPAPTSRIIDSSVNSLEDRPPFTLVKNSLGIPISPVLAPERDLNGLLRVDDPAVASPQGLGERVFKDRGSLDRADFVGPSAVLVNPFDNDADGIDEDQAVTTVQIASGVLAEFTIQLRDGFEGNDPFPGLGIDDDTVSAETITVSRNGQVLERGIDYTYRYQPTNNTIVITPLAGLWPDRSVYEIQLNNRNRFVVDLPDAGTIADETPFFISDVTGSNVRFEFDSGFNLQVAQSVTLLVPAVGAASGGIDDGQRFVVSDDVQSLIFEFDRNNFTLPGNVRVPFTTTSTRDEIAASIVTALQGRGFAARHLGGGQVHVGGNQFTNVESALSRLTQPQETLSLKVPAVGVGPGGVLDGQRFVLRNGALAITFEFDTGNGVAGANTAIDISAAVTQQDVVNAMLPVIRTAGLGLDPVDLGFGVVHLGARAAHSAVMTATALRIVGASRVPRDGERFSVSDGGRTVEFEFDHASGSPGVGMNRVAIPVSRADTYEQIADRVGSAIAAQNLALSGRHLGQGRIYLGGNSQHTLDLSNTRALTSFGRPGVAVPSTTLVLANPLSLIVPATGALGLNDNDAFLIQLGSVVTRFEVDLNASGVTVPGSRLISLVPTDSQMVVADKIVAALAAANIGLAPVNRGTGIVELGATAGHTVTIAGNFTLSGGTVSDGETFTITRGAFAPVRFEFVNVDLGGGAAPGNAAILYSNTSTIDQVADAMIAAIQGTASLALTPTNAGNGRVELNDTSFHTTVLGPGTTLTQIGVPGGTTAVSFIPDATFTPLLLGASMANAIDASQLAGVQLSRRGGASFFLDGAVSVSGIRNTFLPAVQDLAPNSLQGNQADNDTRFTVLLPGTVLDFGDAASQPVAPGFPVVPTNYPVSTANDGARHVVPENPVLFLGRFVDPDALGQTAALADGDDRDHTLVVTGTSLVAGRQSDGLTLQIPVTVNGTADVVDGQTFSISDGFGLDLVQIVFEFDNDNISGFGRTAVPFVPNVTSPAELADALVVLLRQDEVLRLNPVHVGNGLIHLLDDDDDGVTFGSIIIPGRTVPLTVNASSSGLLDGWFDYNQDGDWNDPTEQIFRSIPVLPGANSFTLSVPANAVLGPTYVRFRLSSAGGLLPTGLAVDGEVEDYQVKIITNTPPTLALPFPNLTSREEDPPTVIDLATHFDDIDLRNGNDDFLRFSVVSVTSATGSPVLDATLNGSLLTLSYPLDRNGVATVVVEARDHGNEIVQATFDVTVNPVNDAPTVANPLADRMLNEDALPLSIDLSAVFGDVDIATNNDSLTFAVDTNDNPLVVAANVVGNTLLLTTRPERNGIANISVRATDQAGASVTDTFEVTVIAINDVPVVRTPIADVTLAEDSLPLVLDLSAVFFDSDMATNGELVTLSIVGNTNAALVTPVLSGSGGGFQNTSLRLTLAADRNGTSDITVQATDSIGQFVTDTFRLIVTSVNDAPRVVNAVPDRAVNEDSPATVISLANVFGDVDIATNVPPDALTLSLVSNDNPALVTPVLNGTTLTLTYAPNRNGVATFVVQARDLQNAVVTDTFAVTVNPVNDAPTVAVPIADLTVREDDPDRTLNLSATFADFDILTNGDTLTLTVLGNSNPGLVDATLINNLLTLDFQPDQHGSTLITVQARDQAGVAVTDVFQVVVSPANDNPIVANRVADQNVDEDAVNTVIDLTGVFADVDVITSGDALTVSVQSLDPTLVTATLVANSVLTLDYQDNRNGTTTIQLTARDLAGAIATTTFQVVIRPVNDRPTLQTPIPDVSGSEDGTLSPLDLSAAFRDIDLDPLVLTLVGNDNPALVSPAITGTSVTLALLPNQNGRANITVQARDPAGASITDTFAVIVAPANDAPLRVQPLGTVLIPEDTVSRSIDLSAAFTDVDVVTDGDELSFCLAGNGCPTSSLTSIANFTITGTVLTVVPRLNQTGTASLVVRARDRAATEATDTVTITVTPVNDGPTVPTAIPDLIVAEDSPPRTLDLRGNFADADGDSLTLSVVGNSNANLLSATAAGSSLNLDFVPEANGQADITVQARDPSGATITDTFRVTVTPANDAPIIVLALPPVVVDEDAADVTIDVRPSFGDADIATNGDALTYNLAGNSAPQIVGATLGGGLLTLRFVPNAHGAANVTVEARDAAGATVQQTVPVTVRPRNDAPFVANPIADMTVVEDAPNTVLDLFPRVFDDVDGETPTFRVLANTNPTLVQPTVNGTRLTLAFLANQNGQATLTVEAADAAGATATDTFVVTVTPVNDAPVAVADLVLTTRNQPATIRVLDNDFDVDGGLDANSISIVTQPNDGTVSVANGQITYTPGLDFLGSNAFTYRVRDTAGAFSAPATVTVVVNDRPLARNDSATTNQGTPVTIAVLDNDGDADGAPVASTVAVRQAPQNGSAVVNPGTGAITYTPNPNFTGTDTFSYTVRDDDNLESNLATVTVTVRPVFRWHNAARPSDVSNDGFLSPVDALLIINRLNTTGSGPLPSSPQSPPPFYDASPDNMLTPQDALVVIGALNTANRTARSTPAEGEPVSLTVAEHAAVWLGDSTPTTSFDSPANTRTSSESPRHPLSAPVVGALRADATVESSAWDWLAQARHVESSASSADAALAELLSEDDCWTWLDR